MKKIYQLLALFTLLVSGCSQDEVIKNQSSSSNSLIYTASFEGSESRTYLNEDGYLRWTANDQISIFGANTYNQQYKFTGETGANSGTFEKVSGSYATGTDLSNHYAIYPYNYQTKISETGVITTTIPSEQTYAVNSFGLGDNTMVAVTADKNDTFLKFKNVGGYLELKLYGDNVKIKSIKMEGNSNEKLAGNATITPVYGGTPSITLANDATETITLDCGEGVTISSTAETATTFLLVVPPTTFESGFTIKITDINGSTFTKSTSNKIIVERNMIQPMAAFEVETVETIPNNQIWYTSNNGNIVTPFATDVFGANIKSNVYKNGKGIIAFDGNVNTIGRYAFSNCTSLTSITIPNNVTSIELRAFESCTSLANITIPNSVTSIKNSAIWGCSSLTSIVVEQGNPIYDSRDNCNAIIEKSSNTLISGCKNSIIPNSVTNIGNSAFYCTSLKHITIPNNVTTIEDNAFAFCGLLTSITIPNNVTTIGDYAFFGCNNLSEVHIDATTPPEIVSNTFGNCSSWLKVYVPTECITDYQAADYWKDLNLLPE